MPAAARGGGSRVAHLVTLHCAGVVILSLLWHAQGVPHRSCEVEERKTPNNLFSVTNSLPSSS